VTEKSYYSAIGKYYTKHATITTTWEAKFTRSKYINFKCLAPHQEEFLLQSERSLNLKIPDVGLSRKLFDGVCMVGAYPVFVAIYYQPRKTEIYEIPIRAFLKEKYTSGEKSLSIDRARQIGKLIEI
jgi:penicillin-binding protein-related factor A (putative recombinase)